MAIVNYEQRAEATKKRFFGDPKISDKNKQTVKKFLIAYDVSPARLIIFLEKTRPLLYRTKDITKDMNNRDLINQIYKDIRESKTTKGKIISHSHYATVLNVTLKFVRWLNDGDKPIGFKDIKNSVGSKQKRSLSPKDMITLEDADKLMNGTNSVQLKAVIATQLDGGFRPSEFIELKYGDITQKGDFFIVDIKDGKTGPRSVVLWRCVPHLVRWLQNHPTKKKNDFLWLQEHHNKGEVMKYNYPALVKAIRTLGDKIRLDKPLDFYNLRHSACTISKIDNLPTEEAAKKFGHSVKFYTETYGRLTTDDSIKRLSKVYGLEEDKKKIEKNITCERCDTINSPGTDLCEKCGAALNMKKALEIEGNNKNRNEFTDWLMKEMSKSKDIKNFNEFAVDLIHKEGKGKVLKELV